MSSFAPQRAELVEHTRRAYGNLYSLMRFPTVEESRSARNRRDDLLAELSTTAESCCGTTKWSTGPLPPGCRLCVDGDWSCLFIKGECNASCFFCPKTGNSHTEPTADGLNFRDVADYLSYLRLTGSRGVGISGGEPLLALEDTLKFVSAIRQQIGDSCHIWLYTNGICADIGTLRAIAAAGVNEIRFNIAAVGYRTDAVQAAAKVFSTVVVEIPVIPEDALRLERLLPTLANLGVSALNLHQLWCSPKNVRALSKRPYTFLHGSRVAVLESELIALKVLEYACNRGVDMPVHYCSSCYKDRYQTAASLRRDARLLTSAYEDVTEAGLIRQISVSGSRNELRKMREGLLESAERATDIHLDETRGRLLFRSYLWDYVDLHSFSTCLRYDVGHRVQAAEQTGTSSEVSFGEQRRLRLERSPVLIIPSMTEQEKRSFRELVLCGLVSVRASVEGSHGSSVPFDGLEWVETGQPDYI